MKGIQLSATKQPCKLQKSNTSQAENIPPFQLEQNKVALLETHLNRVCLQQDALMPLLQMIEYIPSIQRTDSIVKGLLRKIDENDLKIAKHDKLFERKFKENTQTETSDKAPKKTQKQFDEISVKVKDIEGQMNNLYRYENKTNFRWYECKLKEESQQISRNMDQKLEKQKTDMQKSFLNETSKTIQQNKSSSYSIQDKNLLSQVESIVQIQVQNLKESMQAEIDSLRDEVNYLRQRNQ